ncbi:hypothetical protein SteCoe_34894 [Stentor coeruleus]|uniref:Uncharacterized protein n=1 Tax=Stentor coeruleus TaxID=5963 RepID=A0A1R2ATR9_9CILI|nr:hypothetical protein SteCoe_34894 [Stentor coeruleus]
MGNCCNKNASGHKKKKVKLNIKWTGVYDVDELFRAAAAPLQTLSDINNSLTKSSKAFRKATFTHVVVGCTTLDSIYGMMYFLSANFEGIIKNLHFKLVSDPPFLKVKKSKLPPDALAVYEAWEGFAIAIYETPEKIKELQPQIETLIEESKEFPDRAQAIIKNNNIGITQAISAGKRISKNASKIANAKKVIDDTIKLIEDTMKDIEGFKGSYEENKGQIETIGKKAKEENCVHPKQLVPKYWPDQTRIDLSLDIPPKPKPTGK